VSVEGWDWAASEPGPVAGKAEAEPEDPWAFGERFEHEPGRLVERDGHRVEHDDLSQAQADRLDAVEAARADRIRGGGDLLGLEAGTTLTLHGHPHPELGESYLVTRAVHRGDCPQVDIGESSPFAGADYENTFEAQVLDLPYRARRRDKPRVLGPQTAVVVGPPGEEIHTDALGRVQVRMRWDRQQRDRSDETSCWLRVAQLWAGAGWGALFLPRVGMEVLVAFVDGDPDRPMVAGTLYNGAHEPPYPLPEQRTRSTIRTQSSPGGEGFNELRFDDAAGAEEVYLHAQRDHNEEAERNHTQRVGASQSIRVGRDQAQRIGGSRRVEVGSEEHVVVGKAPSDPDSPPPPPLEPATQTTEVHGSIATKAHETIVVDATQSLTLRVGGTSITVTPGGIALAVDGGATLDLTQALQVASAQQQGTLQLDERGVATLASKQGGSLRLDEDLNVETKGGTSLTMDEGAKLHTGGGAKLEMSKTIDLLARAIAAAIDGDETKLELAARLARLASSETAEVIGGSSSVATSSTGVEGSGPKIDLQAAGLLNLQGAITKINE
jgi:type VI secretion system secreted protein VgrG